MIHLSRETETLATQLAEARGISLEEAVKVALEETSKESHARQKTGAAFSTRTSCYGALRRFLPGAAPVRSSIPVPRMNSLAMTIMAFLDDRDR